MKRRSLIVSIILLAVVLAGAYAYKEYNRKPADLAISKAALFVNAKTLVSAYLANEEEANKKYLGKIIEVKGTVVSTGELNIILGDETSTNNVSCMLDSARHATSVLPQPGTQVTVKGICTGFLLDVELNRGLIVNH
jgi:hypothetical protein